jgi:hypothetical protein
VFHHHGDAGGVGVLAVGVKLDRCVFRKEGLGLACGKSCGATSIDFAIIDFHSAV